MNNTKIFIILCLLIIIFAVMYSTRAKPSIDRFTTNEKLTKPPNEMKIYILYTGGTIGMFESATQGLVPKKGLLETKLDEIMNDEKTNRNHYGQYTINEYSPLLDSSNLYPKDWIKIASDINAVYDKYDAFIIIHGTDTMAYTSSALAFMFENLTKTIVITGSMLPLVQLRNDGRNNLINSLYIASNRLIPEVVILFDDKIIRGCRATKINSNKVDAFSSPNYPILGFVDVDVSINERLIFKNREDFRFIPFKTDFKVISLKLFPGIDAIYVKNILIDPTIKGVVLETFGIGDAPTNKEFLAIIAEHSKKGVIFINITQCYMGYVDQKDYQTGVELLRAGVFSGKDMRPEAGIAKLYYLLTLYDVERAKQLISKNLRGELTEDREVFNEMVSF